MMLFFGSLLLFFLGGLGSLASHTHSRFVSGVTAAIASIGMMIFAGNALATGGVQHLTLPTQIPLFELSFHIDMLSSLFIFLIGLIALPVSLFGISYLKHYKLYDLHVFGFFYNLFLMTLFLIVTSYNGLSFLFFWEIMSLTSVYFVLFERERAGAVHAGAVYFIMTHVAAFCLLIAFLLLYQRFGSFDFGLIKASASQLSLGMYSVLFGLFLVGFGTKAGIIPFHIWLPKAHSSAPAHTSALMSGIMIKMGIFMFFRIFLDILPPTSVVFGSIVLVLGGIASILGVLYALAEHDIKRLLAYHSIENIGIILLGLGGGMIFFSLGQYPLAVLAIVAGLFHTINHAVFKSLLFLGAGAVMHQVHTRDMEKFGGLIKKMPLTALFFLIGSVAISGLPPLNGFVSEWLTFQSLIKGILISSGSILPAVFILAITALAFTGGLAGACFVKAFAVTFLARPRSREAEHAEEVGPLFIGGMGMLAVLCLLLSVFSGFVVSLLTRVVQGMSTGKAATVAFSTAQGTLTTGNGFGTMNIPFVVAGIALMVGVGWLGVYAVARKRKEIRRMIWDCGYTQLTPRMEITTTGFARTLILIFKGIFQPTKQDKIEYVDIKSRYQPLSRTIILGVTNHYEKHVYYPLHNSFFALSLQIKKIQGGNISQYLLYIFLTLIGLLIWVRY